MKYTAEEVREVAATNEHPIPLRVRDMLTAYADSLERAQGGVTDGVVDVAHDTIFGHPSFDIGENGFLGKPAVRAALLAVWPNPPAQAAQGEAACPKCGATNSEDAAIRCCPDEDSCPGCEEPLAQAWDRKAAQPAQSVDVEKVREVIAHLRSFRSNTPPTWAHLDDAADKLEAAIKGGA